MKLIKNIYDLYVYRLPDDEPCQISTLDVSKEEIESIIPRLQLEDTYTDSLTLTEEEIKTLQARIGEPIEIDFEQNQYVIVLFGEYDWTK